MEGGALAQSVGSVIGVGQGRGIALLFIIAGVFVMLIAGITSQLGAIKSLENGFDTGPTDQKHSAQD